MKQWMEELTEKFLNEQAEERAKSTQRGGKEKRFDPKTCKLNEDGSDFTDEQYDQMYDDQNGKCAICGHYGEKLHRDHDHSSGLVRALLCLNCNNGLGHFRDSFKICLSAAKYLRRFR